MNAALEVTVVIPARNGLPDVLEAVDSVLAQTLPPVEVVVVDSPVDLQPASARHESTISPGTRLLMKRLLSRGGADSFAAETPTVPYPPGSHQALKSRRPEAD